MTTELVLPLSETQMAVAELGEMLARGREPAELEVLGWPNIAGLMEQRRALIRQEEIAAGLEAME